MNTAKIAPPGPPLLQFASGAPVETNGDWMRRRGELLEILAREEYGFTPPPPRCVRSRLVRKEEKCCAGHAWRENRVLAFDTPGGEFSFPVCYFFPKTKEKVPVFVLIHFSAEPYHRYCPVEEIIDNGFALAVVYYQDITKDNADMSDGIAGCYPRREEATDWGKIGMWAFGMSRVIDDLFSRPEIDTSRIAAIGHSRLGKTALWCGAQDARVAICISNNSGCGGAAYERTKHPQAETIAYMNGAFPYWFCGNRARHAGHEQKMPFDQHFLLAACAPRKVCVGSAEEDLWADPASEKICCQAASCAWEKFGNPEDLFYHFRDGIHFLSRADWNAYMRFIREHTKL